MLMSLKRALATAAFTLACITRSRAYCIKDTHIGHDFFHKWTWETFNDPTHGRVNYVDQLSARTANLSFASFDKFVMRADNAQVVSPTTRGRDSVRITSKMAYAESLIIIDLSHIPSGCGTWPAFWTLSQAGPWPKGGEIDIIEGVHVNTQNLASLHTLPGCSMQEPREQMGQTVSLNCDTSVNFNQGCGTSFTKLNSYGSGFNSAGGGWYALERSKDKGISVWFWPRNDPDVPIPVKHGFNTIFPDPTWGYPEARFPPDSCNQDTYFDAHQMIFDITFCGDWAGATFSQSGCGAGLCSDFVDLNPVSFTEAYWEIDSIRIYQ